MPTAAKDSGPASIVLVRGEEQLLVDRAISRVAARARRAAPDLERRDATGAGLSEADFASLVAPSLFAEPRLVVLRGAQELLKDVAAAVSAYASDPVEGVILVVHHSGGARNKPLADGLAKAGADVVNCAKISHAGERIDFVRGEIKAAGGTASSDAAEAIVEAVGNDLAELAAAASQLVADTGGLVDAAAVRRYYRGRAEVTGFTIADFAVAGNVAGALEALRWALAIGVHPVLVADALADGVRSVAKVAGARRAPAQQLARELGMAPWKIDKARGVARGWSRDGLIEAMAVTAAVNAEVKGGAVDAEYALERAVMNIGRAHRMS